MKVRASPKRASKATFTRNNIRPGHMYRVTFDDGTTMYVLGSNTLGDAIAVDVDSGVMWSDGGVTNVTIDHLPDAVVDIGQRCVQL